MAAQKVVVERLKVLLHIRHILGSNYVSKTGRSAGIFVAFLSPSGQIPG
jgi:hypothetical protein